MGEMFGQIFLFILGLAVELGAPLFLTKTKQKQMVRLLGGIIIFSAAGWAGYALGQSRTQTQPPPLPANIYRRFDFENGPDRAISLDVCEAVLPTYYENCYAASSRLFWSSNHFTGGHSLGFQADLLPGTELVYSVNIPVYPPARIDAVSANIYIPEAVQPDKIWLLVRINGEDRWKFSEIKNTGSGWTRLFLDLQGTASGSGLTASQQGIDEVDVDVFLPRTARQSQSAVIELDDIELYFPSSSVVNPP